MKKIYMKPQMEVMEMNMQGVLVGSTVDKIASGDVGYKGGGTGGGRAPMMTDFDDFEDFENQFDFTDIQLW